MAGQAHNRGTERNGRPGGRLAASRSAAAPGGPQITALPRDAERAAEAPAMQATPHLLPAPLAPEIVPGPILTRPVYRTLTMRGLAPAEAANVTALLAGLHVAADSPWTLRQVNRILFLRALYASESWGTAERQPA